MAPECSEVSAKIKVFEVKILRGSVKKVIGSKAVNFMKQETLNYSKTLREWLIFLLDYTAGTTPGAQQPFFSLLHPTGHKH